jgi:hypothetical protein
MFSFCMSWLELSLMDEENSQETKREFATRSRGGPATATPGVIYRAAMLLENLELAFRFYKFHSFCAYLFNIWGAQRFRWQRANPQDRPNRYIHIAKGALL